MMTSLDAVSDDGFHECLDILRTRWVGPDFQTSETFFEFLWMDKFDDLLIPVVTDSVAQQLLAPDQLLQFHQQLIMATVAKVGPFYKYE